MNPFNTDSCNIYIYIYLYMEYVHKYYVCASYFL